MESLRVIKSVTVPVRSYSNPTWISQTIDLKYDFMKYLLSVLTGYAVLITPFLHAGTEVDEKAIVASNQTTTEPVPLDLFTWQQAYVFESDLNHGGSLGKQDEIQSEFEYGHRIQLHDNIYLHLGISYDRYDFGSTKAPVPNHLQALAGVVGIDIMHGKDVGAFIEFRPGFYTENDFGISSFDVPIALGTIFVVKPDKLYLFAGAYAAFLQGGYPIYPLGGVIWILNDKVRLMGVMPDPKLIYSATDKLDLWLGGQLVGGSFRTDRNDQILPKKLNGTQVDFDEYRAGLGLTYDLTKTCSLDFSAGCSIQRHFAFHRAGENYRTDPSPYVSLKLKASF